MPSYDYYCPKCGNTKEIFHSMTQEPTYRCVCGAQLERKVSGGTTTLYKSPGFTQYKGRNGS